MRVELAAKVPFDGSGLLDFFAARAVPGIEEVTEGVYRRSVRLPGGPALIELEPRAASVSVRISPSDPGDGDEAQRRCRALFGLDADPAAVNSVLTDDPLIAPLVAATPGRRVPGCADPAELAVRAVLGQQVSLAAARTLAARLVAECGEPLAEPRGSVTHLFPAATAIAAYPAERLAMPRSRARAVLTLGGALASGELELGSEADCDRAREAMLAVPGIGPWTAEYVAMRALGDRDAFLPTDLGVRHALVALGAAADSASAAARAESWRPYRAYALQHLWASSAAAPTARAGLR